MNTNKIEYYDIVDGPNKDVMFDACKYAYSEGSEITVDFKVATGYTAPVGSHQAAYKPMAISDIVICGIEHEDGSSNNFIVRGYCSANVGSSIYKPHGFVAYYNTKKRRGKISFS